MAKVGIIGNTGRMGLVLEDILNQHELFSKGLGFNSSNKETSNLASVFKDNDYLIDFSHPSLIRDLLQTAKEHSKPVIICTTGWEKTEHQDLLQEVAKTTALVITTNTSIGAFMQRELVKKLATLLGSDYDIDITEKHHRNKVDIPSGTANSLLQDIQASKSKFYNATYTSFPLESGKRPDNFIGMHVHRSGNIYGDHEVSFTSDSEMISIRHVAFSAKLFAKGAIKIVEWLHNNQPLPGIYGIEDIIKL